MALPAAVLRSAWHRHALMSNMSNRGGVTRVPLQILLRRTTTTTTGSTANAMDIEHHSVHDKDLRLVYYPPPASRKHALLRSTDEYYRLHADSLADPDRFWGDYAKQFTWQRKWDRVLEYDFVNGPTIKWFQGGELNITENALDRHVDSGHGGAPAITFEGDDGSSRTYSFAEVLDEVCALARVLRKHGVRKGDRVSLCLPMIPQAAFAMLACARIGAVHSAIFAGFSVEAVAERIVNCGSSVVLTADAGLRGGKPVPLKSIMDAACDIAKARGHAVSTLLVTHRAGAGTGEGTPGWVAGRDVSLDAEISAVRAAAPAAGGLRFPAEPMAAEDPLFVLYTSGSTGKPKGVVHTVAGYMVWVACTFQYVFNARPSAAASSTKTNNISGNGHAATPDLHFCTADLGWVTGHSYIVYGPLLTGTHTLLFEGTPMYPGPDRLWSTIAKHRATTLYTAPTAIRSLMGHGAEPVGKHDLSSLRMLGSVGEPINPEAWRWYHTVVGKGALPIIDTWWQTETGGIMISGFEGTTHMKPGVATKPFFGVDAHVVHADGRECGPDEGGFLVIDKPWPGMARSLWGDHARFKSTYFQEMPGRYFTGDGAVKDRDGDIQILGRTDDVVNVSGHRLGTAEVESALSLHHDVVETAVVGFPHQIKGEGLYCFIVLKKDVQWSAVLEKELTAIVRKQIGPIATPDVLHNVPDLPKTRSGKIMRRILRRIAAGEADLATMGDLSTLANPTLLTTLVSTRIKPAAPAATSPGVAHHQKQRSTAVQ